MFVCACFVSVFVYLRVYTRKYTNTETKQAHTNIEAARPLSSRPKGYKPVSTQTQRQNRHTYTHTHK